MHVASAAPPSSLSELVVTRHTLAHRHTCCYWKQNSDVDMAASILQLHGGVSIAAATVKADNGTAIWATPAYVQSAAGSSSLQKPCDTSCLIVVGTSPVAIPPPPQPQPNPPPATSSLAQEADVVHLLTCSDQQLIARAGCCQLLQHCCNNQYSSNNVSL